MKDEIRLLKQRLKEMEQTTKLTDDSLENAKLQQHIAQLQQQLDQVIQLRASHQTVSVLFLANRKEMKGKEEYLYSAFIQRLVSKRSDMDHTFYLQITPCLPFLRKRSPDGASTECGGEHLIASHYSFIDPKRMKG